MWVGWGVGLLDVTSDDITRYVVWFLGGSEINGMMIMTVVNGGDWGILVSFLSSSKTSSSLEEEAVDIRRRCWRVSWGEWQILEAGTSPLGVISGRSVCSGMIKTSILSSVFFITSMSKFCSL